MQYFPLKLYTGRVNGTSSNQHDNNCDINGSSYHNYNRSLSKLYLIIFFVIFLVAIFVVLPLLVHYNRPSVPEFQIESLMVTSMKVYNDSKDYFSIIQNETQITADLDFTLTLKNKDQGLIYFDPMQVSLEYHQDELLSSTSLEAFLLDEYQHQLHFGMQIKDDAHLQNKTITSICQDLWSKNVVQFALKAKGHYVRWHRSYVDKCDIELVCDDIKVGFSPANNLTTGSMIVSPVPCNSESDCMQVYY